MLRMTKKDINQMEKNYPGIKEQIWRFENANLPPCAFCGSDDTADVQIGIIGRNISISAATTKVSLTPNGPKKGTYRCNACGKYFSTIGNEA